MYTSIRPGQVWDTEERVKKCLEEGNMMFICNYPSNGKEILTKFGLI